MRTKLFFAFLVVIVIALISNLLFEKFMVRDFEDYVSGAKEDKLYWILASVEGCYSDAKWDLVALQDAIHWATMLGFDIRISDDDGNEIISSGSILPNLSPAMRRRMRGIVNFGSAKGEYEQYPLYVEGKEIGTMYARRLGRAGSVDKKEAMFKKRGREFLVMSFAMAGGGAVFMAVIFSLFLSRPLKKMKKAVESFAAGDFSVRVDAASKKDELGRLASSFNFMAEALEREEALRKHLTSNVAHELRTPLSIMKANVEGMIDGVVENRAVGLENLRIETEKLIGLVEGIEDMTKAEASFFSGRKSTDIDLHRFIGGITTKLAPLAAEKGLEMKVKAEKSIHVMSDPDKLERILQNILTNAIKNTGEGGISLDYGTKGDTFFVEVADTGSGIPEDRMDMVFRRFYRGEESAGIGLGLAIVKELVEVMGGSIDLKSRVGEGSTFRVWLPVGGKK
ncbi:MAG: HAMP domain-containing sensor histidine kinase [Nitrospiraceae bacterium]|nr:HAMP domain-containing sensor histidine kinase [Nitrospiraceae bacterium]